MSFCRLFSMKFSYFIMRQIISCHSSKRANKIIINLDLHLSTHAERFQALLFWSRCLGTLEGLGTRFFFSVSKFQFKQISNSTPQKEKNKPQLPFYPFSNLIKIELSNYHVPRGFIKFLHLRHYPCLTNFIRLFIGKSIEVKLLFWKKFDFILFLNFLPIPTSQIAPSAMIKNKSSTYKFNSYAFFMPVSYS